MEPVVDIPRKRGRPASKDVERSIEIGRKTNYRLKCHFCKRNFPRNKSLRAHIKIHTGEKPFVCTYPRCHQEFVQSGQLRSHICIHTGEKHFKCPIRGCPRRYTHSSRKCCDHGKKVFRDGIEDITVNMENLSPQEILWIERFKARMDAKKRAKQMRALKKACQMGEKTFNKHKNASRVSKHSSRMLKNASNVPYLQNETSMEYVHFNKESFDQGIVSQNSPASPNCDTSGYGSFSSGSEDSLSPNHSQLSEETNQGSSTPDVFWGAQLLLNIKFGFLN